VQAFSGSCTALFLIGPQGQGLTPMYPCQLTVVQAAELSKQISSWGVSQSWRLAVQQRMRAMTHLNYSQKQAVGSALLSTLTLWQVSWLTVPAHNWWAEGWPLPGQHMTTHSCVSWCC
jgi:hypothetical protein